jgi:hypothetical protein
MYQDIRMANGATLEGLHFQGEFFSPVCQATVPESWQGLLVFADGGTMRIDGDTPVQVMEIAKRESEAFR